MMASSPSIFRSTTADFSAALLDKALLLGAHYDAHTRWPAGFDALKHGAKLVK